MEPLNGKFQRFQKDAEAKIFHQNIFLVNEQAANEDIEQENNQNEPTALPELSKGSKGEMVMKAQRILKTTSDYVGYVDGDFGWVMEAAVQSFQRRSKVAITGIINDETWEALNQIRR
ncbi:MAG: peptidoglycan-binding domain-containing protein [Cyanobacteria bacterium P01_A01_bin.68]